MYIICRGDIILKKSVAFLLILLLSISLSGCSEISKLVLDVDFDNPLSFKDTDERIIMCLEEAYPEHKFSVSSSYDRSEGKGVYEDDTGIEFNVQNIIYNNSYHFGCSDDYLKTILENQNYIDKVEDIVIKHNLSYKYNDSIVRINTSVNDEMADVSTAIYEILNCVNVPEVIWPKEQGFSTGVVNYYTTPNWGLLLCRCEMQNKATNVVFYLGDVNLTQQEIEQRLDTCYKRIQE